MGTTDYGVFLKLPSVGRAEDLSKHANFDFSAAVNVLLHNSGLTEGAGGKILL